MLQPAEPKSIQLDPITLLTHASLPVKATVAVLVIASTLVWLITILKVIQLLRLQGAQSAFQDDANRATSASQLFAVSDRHPRAPGGRVLKWVAMRGAPPNADRLRAIVERALVEERQHASAFLSVLGTIAAVSPFIGLVGTVYGIIDAFARIGAEKSAALHVVAPAIGEALFATLIGLAAAIPAVVFHNAIDRWIERIQEALEAAAQEWVQIVAQDR